MGLDGLRIEAADAEQRAQDQALGIRTWRDWDERLGTAPDAQAIAIEESAAHARDMGEALDQALQIGGDEAS
jgi:hypothetical protein